MAIKLKAVIPIGKDVDKDFSAVYSSINQTATSIGLEVERATNTEEFLSGQIEIVAGAITLKADTTTVDSLTGRISTAEGSISVLSGQIDLKASQTAVDDLTGRLGMAEGSITVLAGQVSLKATQTSVDALTGRVSTAEGSITTMSNQIVLKVDKAGVIGAINLSSESATISASKINLVGYITATNLATAGQTIINGSNVTTGLLKSANYVANSSGTMINLADGTIDSRNFKVSSTGNVTANNGSFNNGYFSGTIFSTGWDGNTYGTWYEEVSINSGILTLSRTRYDSGGGSTTTSDTTLNYNKLNTQEVNASNAVWSDMGDFKQLLMGNVGNAQVIYDSSDTLRPQSTTRTYSLGSSSYPWSNIYVKTIYHTSGSLGFFNTSPKTKTSVADLSTSATLAQAITKINDLLNVLQGYGLV